MDLWLAPSKPFVISSLMYSRFKLINYLVIALFAEEPFRTFQDVYGDSTCILVPHDVKRTPKDYIYFL